MPEADTVDDVLSDMVSLILLSGGVWVVSIHETVQSRNLGDPKYKEFEPYIRKTAEQHIKLHHQTYLEEADGGKALKELAEIMKNIGYKGFEAENSKNSAKSTMGKIKGVLIAGGKFGFNVVLESLKQGVFKNYVKQQAIEQSKKVGRYVMHCIADRFKKQAKW